MTRTDNNNQNGYQYTNSLNQAGRQVVGFHRYSHEQLSNNNDSDMKRALYLASSKTSNSNNHNRYNNSSSNSNSIGSMIKSVGSWF